MDIFSETDSSEILDFIQFRKSFTNKELSEFAKEDYIEKQRKKIEKEKEEQELKELEEEDNQGKNIT